MKGKLYVFEGPDCAGKTHLLSKLYGLWPYRAANFREPGSTLVAEKIRTILLHTGHESVHICDKARACLFFAARSQLVQERIIPALDSGQDVLLDRYWLSTAVYNLWADHADVAIPIAKNWSQALGFPEVYKWIVCLPPIPTLLHRNEMKAKDDMDPKSDEMVVALAKRYEIAQDYFRRDRFIVVREAEPVVGDVLKLIHPNLPERVDNG